MKRKSNSLVYQHLTSFNAKSVLNQNQTNIKKEESSSSDEEPLNMKKRISRTRSKAMCKSPDVKRAALEAPSSTNILHMIKSSSVDIKAVKKKDIFWTLFKD